MHRPAPVPTCWLHFVYVPLMGSLKKDKTYTIYIYLNQIKTHLHEYFGSTQLLPNFDKKKRKCLSNGTKARVKAAATAPIIDATKMKKGKSIQSQSCMKIRFGKTNQCAKSYRKSSSPNAAPKSFRFYQLSYFVPSDIQSPTGLVMEAFDLKCRYFGFCQQPPWNLHLSS